VRVPGEKEQSIAEAAMEYLNGGGEEPAAEAQELGGDGDVLEGGDADGDDLLEQAARAAEDLTSMKGVRTIKVSGREIPVTEEQLIEYAQRGYDHTARNSELKQRESELQETIAVAQSHRQLLEALKTPQGVQQVLDAMLDTPGVSQSVRQQAIREWYARKGLAPQRQRVVDDLDDDFDTDDEAGDVVTPHSSEIAELKAQVAEINRREEEVRRRSQSETLSSQIDEVLSRHESHLPKGSIAHADARGHVAQYLQQTPGASLEQAAAYALDRRIKALKEDARLTRTRQQASEELRTLTGEGSVPATQSGPDLRGKPLKSKAVRDDITKSALSLLEGLV
jgi:hypothetical protein